jgi:hypothetical protein
MPGAVPARQLTEEERIAMDEAGERYDRWVENLGGSSSERYRALYREAFEFVGGDSCMSYLQMAMEIDEDHEAHKRGRAAGCGQAAAAAALQRATEIQLAAETLLSDPRLAADPDFSTRPPMGRAEIDLELRAAMGLANRAPTIYEAMLPPVGDVARIIGVKS